jgi:hypothetical protein
MTNIYFISPDQPEICRLTISPVDDGAAPLSADTGLPSPGVGRFQISIAGEGAGDLDQ